MIRPVYLMGFAMLLGIVLVFTVYFRNPKIALNSGAPSSSSGQDAATSHTELFTRGELVSDEMLNATLTNLNGGSFRLADYRGKVLVLDIWASWCSPCREEIPQLVDISNKYASQGVYVIGLTVQDPLKEGADVMSFASANITYPVGYMEGQMSGPLTTLVGSEHSIPQTFVIDRQGYVLEHTVGYSPADMVSTRLAIDQACAAH